jgi:hypothetical protein
MAFDSMNMIATGIWYDEMGDWWDWWDWDG